MTWVLTSGSDTYKHAFFESFGDVVTDVVNPFKKISRVVDAHEMEQIAQLKSEIRFLKMRKGLVQFGNGPRTNPRPSDS